MSRNMNQSFKKRQSSNNKRHPEIDIEALFEALK